ncbi:hypothetical protein OUZ56_018961 [Daphnia magna]|uniref:Uncharacterized protein n=1 Tax=Daphnia magna TaxID=35525 RepID=A0ABQ9ZA83_9CRUS|nr:hypothetical protein OUZ56_018961 [Daphnia magna]
MPVSDILSQWKTNKKSRDNVEHGLKTSALAWSSLLSYFLPSRRSRFTRFALVFLPVLKDRPFREAHLV